MPKDWRDAGPEMEAARQRLAAYEAQVADSTRTELLAICRRYLSNYEMSRVLLWDDIELRSFAGELLYLSEKDA